MAHAKRADAKSGKAQSGRKASKKGLLVKLRKGSAELNAKETDAPVSDWHPSCGPFPTD